MKRIEPTTPDNTPSEPVLSDTLRVLIVLVIFLITGITFVWLGAERNNPTSAVIWVLASYIIGTAVGFLFGIPRVLQGNASQAGITPATSGIPADSDGSQRINNYDLRVNTNLEQISDWLTKIIVGLGLVELQSAPAHIKRIAAYIAQGIGPHTEYFAAGFVIYFFILGFIGSYLITRLYIAGAFSRADQEASLRIKKDLLRVENIELPPLGQPHKLSLSDNRAAKNVASTPLSTLSAPEGATTWAKAQLSLGNYRAAIKGYERAIHSLKGAPEKRFAYATALYYTGNSDQSFQQLLEAYNELDETTDKELQRNIYRSLTYQALYQTPPDGFNQAIRYAEEYISNTGNLHSPDIWVNLAAAYGQKMKWLSASDASDPNDLARTRSSALQAVRQAVEAGKQWKQKIQKLLYKGYPNKDPREDDLEIFANDPEFREIAGVS